jgi:hypothetical protein
MAHSWSPKQARLAGRAAVADSNDTMNRMLRSLAAANAAALTLMPAGCWVELDAALESVPPSLTYHFHEARGSSLAPSSTTPVPGCHLLNNPGRNG